jgi:hypothetical protein
MHCSLEWRVSVLARPVFHRTSQYRASTHYPVFVTNGALYLIALHFVLQSSPRQAMHMGRSVSALSSGDRLDLPRNQPPPSSCITCAHLIRRHNLSLHSEFRRLRWRIAFASTSKETHAHLRELYFSILLATHAMESRGGAHSGLANRQASAGL